MNSMTFRRFSLAAHSQEAHFRRLFIPCGVFQSIYREFEVGSSTVGSLSFWDDVCFLLKNSQIDIHLLIFELPDQCFGSGILDL